VHQTPVLSVDELNAQSLELLPARETLFFDINIAPVVAVNIALAVNAATIGSTAIANAGQHIFVFQH
jgi:hypothetical protein